jgi:hypothetical protein
LCVTPADRQFEIDHSAGSNEDAGPGCTVTYDFVACKQTLHCVQTTAGITSTVDNVTTWTSTEISGTEHVVTSGGPVNLDCTYTYTMTKQ